MNKLLDNFIENKNMVEIEFNYNGDIYNVKCKENERLKDAYENIAIQNQININKIDFLYNNDRINDKLPINQFINVKDKQKKKMKIVINSIDSKENQNDKLKRKDIICPKCGHSINIKIKDYKILLYDCKNEHKFDKILLDEFKNTQKLEPDMKCKNCKDRNNVDKIYYRCYNCKINLCHFCYTIHNQTHKIVNCDKNNYICSIHGDKLISFCKTCKLNICVLCKNKHNFHEIIDFSNITPDKEIIIKNKKEFKKNIELFYNNIKEIINILNKIAQNIEQYFQIYCNIINSFENDEINYQILNNLNEIINNNIIQKDIIITNKQNNIKHKFINIMEMYDKMSKKNTEENNEITIIYKVKENENSIKIFDSAFVKNNKKWCKIYYEDKECNLTTDINVKDINLNIYDNNLELKLKNIKKITNLSHMFANCSSLISLPDIYKWETSKITNMNYLFFGCSSLKSLPDISNWDTSNVIDMQWMFARCSSLKELPDISKWNMGNVKDLNWMFCGCSSLESLPDISKWDTKNVIDMHCMFCGCSSLTYLPDISKWDTKNVTDMNSMFFKCSSLSFIPDISKWDTSNVINMSWMFCECISLSFIPDITKWNIQNIVNMNCMFYECRALSLIPDISNWNISHITDTNWMFGGCQDNLNIPLKFKK